MDTMAPLITSLTLFAQDREEGAKAKVGGAKSGGTVVGVALNEQEAGNVSHSMVDALLMPEVCSTTTRGGNAA